MKKILLALGCSLLLAGCSTPPTASHAYTIDFRTGSSREAVKSQLQQMRATVLEDKPDLVRAEVVRPDVPHPMPVELRFADDKLSSVSYGPAAGGSAGP